MFRKFVITALILVYLVIIAGAVVRMTGSGMGCPDWPKCFGYYIPPTQHAQLEWHPHHEFHEGQVIILNETLQVSTRDFTSTTEFEGSNWEPYTKHDYAVFNPVHTWVEYINRLFGALAGLGVLAMAIASIWQWKRNKKITVYSWVSVFLMGFQAWLGAVVVYSLLTPIKITIHMVAALVIVALILYILHQVRSKDERFSFNPLFKSMLVVAAIFSLIQIVLGTEVRQYIDEQIKSIGYQQELWLSTPTIQFYIHRSFSIVVFLINFFLWIQNRSKGLGYRLLNWVMVLIILEIITGITMFYLDFPYATQAIHLVIATVLFGVQFYVLLQCFSTKKSTTITSNSKSHL